MNYNLMIDLHKNNVRQGPGSDAHTILAMKIANIFQNQHKIKIADIGCGTGSQTIALAKNTQSEIYAVDLFDDFLVKLDKNAKLLNLTSKIHTKKCSMDCLDFEVESLDVIWSEGALYNMGFTKAISYLKQFLKKAGIIACSEITWLTKNRPTALTEHWLNEYSEIGLAESKIKVLNENNFNLIGYFLLDEACWMDNYYTQLENNFNAFLKANSYSQEAQAIVKAEQREIDLYKKYKKYINYGFYIAKKEC